MKNDLRNKKNKDYSVQILRLLEIIEGMNEIIEIGKKQKDSLVIRQHEYQKSKYVKELIELLSKYQLTVQIKEAEIREAA